MNTSIAYVVELTGGVPPELVQSNVYQTVLFCLARAGVCI